MKTKNFDKFIWCDFFKLFDRYDLYGGPLKESIKTLLESKDIKEDIKKLDNELEIVEKKNREAWGVIDRINNRLESGGRGGRWVSPLEKSDKYKEKIIEYEKMILDLEKDYMRILEANIKAHEILSKMESKQWKTS